MAVASAFFMARRKAMRRSSWVAMFSATSWALVSALRTSWTSMKTSLSVNDATPGKSVSPLRRADVAALQGLDALAALADHHAGARRVDDHLGAVGRTLDLHAAMLAL
jgi:hypothetical protein